MTLIVTAATTPIIATCSTAATDAGYDGSQNREHNGKRNETDCFGNLLQFQWKIRNKFSHAFEISRTIYRNDIGF
jgi:hypothetical protein